MLLSPREIIPIFLLRCIRCQLGKLFHEFGTVLPYSLSSGWCANMRKMYLMNAPRWVLLVFLQWQPRIILIFLVAIFNVRLLLLVLFS